MRKTFVVGRLTVNSTHILLLDNETSSASASSALRSLHTPHTGDPKLPDPHTVH